MDLSVRIGPGTLPNPVGVASGTFGYGSEYEKLIDLSIIGALYTKAVTPEVRPGNATPRIIETPAGMLNSIGLANNGLAGFRAAKIPYLRTLPCPAVVNVAGAKGDDYAKVIEELAAEDCIWGWEVNLSCPNVKTGGLALGTDPTEVEQLTARLRKLTSKPLIIKLTPNVTDITAIARAAEAGGADAVSCINTLVGMVIDTKALRPVLPGKTGGLSGPAILPVGLAAVYRVARAVRIPVVGLGGISEADHAVQYLLAGAHAVQIGTANFIDPTVHQKVLDGIRAFAALHNLKSIPEFHQFID